MEDFECLWRMYIDCIMYIVKEIKLAATGIQYTSYLHHFAIACRATTAVIAGFVMSGSIF